MRDIIADHVRARVEQLANDLTDTIWLQMQRTLDDALDAARSALLSDLALIPTVEATPLAQVTPTTNRAPAASPKPASSPTRKPPPVATADVKRCSKCGEPGRRANGCGISHNIGGAAKPVAAPVAPAKVDLDPPPPRLSTIERTALEKPCRDPNCRIVKLHPAHGESP